MRSITTRHIAACVLAALAVALMVAGMTIPSDQVPPDGTGFSTATEQTVIPTGCDKVTIYSGRRGFGAFRKYGEVIKRMLEEAGPTSQHAVRLDRKVEVIMDDRTDGTIYNVQHMAGEQNPECRLALAQLNVAADAVEGFFKFKPTPDGTSHAIPDLRAAGPIYYNFIHMMVREDSHIFDISDLCGEKVSVDRTSGEAQVIEVIKRNIPGIPDCEIEANFNFDGMDALKKKDSGVAAVLLATAAPNPELQDEAQAMPIRFLPMHNFRAAFQEDFDALYGQLNEKGRRFYPGDVFEAAVLETGDYQGMRETQTFSIPNGVAVRAGADAGLVQFVTHALFAERTAFERSFWKNQADQRGRSFPGPELVSENPLFCYVRPHDAAEGFYMDEAVDGGYTYLNQCWND